MAAGVRNAHRFAAMTPAERASATPDQIEYDRGPLFIEDLRALPSSPLIVVDNALAKRSVAAPGQAVWLMPSQSAQQTRLEQRHPDGVPPRYLWDWKRITEAAAESTAPKLTVDDLTVEQTIAAVERIFADRLAEGPTATTIEQRRELLRYSNQTIVDQHLGWFAHYPGDLGRSVDENVGMFDCECARPGCFALVEMSIGSARPAMAAEPPNIVADGHSTD